MKPTAVEFAVEQLEQLIPSGHQLEIRIILEQALEMEKKIKYNDIDMVDYAHHILNNDVISPEEWASRYKHQSNKDSL